MFRFHFAVPSSQCLHNLSQTNHSHFHYFCFIVSFIIVVQNTLKDRAVMVASHCITLFNTQNVTETRLGTLY